MPDTEHCKAPAHNNISTIKWFRWGYRTNGKYRYIDIEVSTLNQEKNRYHHNSLYGPSEKTTIKYVKICLKMEMISHIGPVELVYMTMGFFSPFSKDVYVKQSRETVGYITGMSAQHKNRCIVTWSWPILLILLACQIALEVTGAKTAYLHHPTWDGRIRKWETFCSRCPATEMMELVFWSKTTQSFQY